MGSEDLPMQAGTAHGGQGDFMDRLYLVSLRKRYIVIQNLPDGYADKGREKSLPQQ